MEYLPKIAMSIQAHPDDQDFSIAGTLAKWAKTGCEIISVIITSGDSGSNDVTKGTGYKAELARLRGSELVGRAYEPLLPYFADKKTKAPFPRALKFAEKFVAAAQDAGLIVWPNTGHADGEDGDLVMIAPPFTISEAEIDEIVSHFKIAHRAAVEACHVRP